jgi:penicillin-insensitive murein endopeptidase
VSRVGTSCIGALLGHLVVLLGACSVLACRSQTPARAQSMAKSSGRVDIDAKPNSPGLEQDGRSPESRDSSIDDTPDDDESDENTAVDSRWNRNNQPHPFDSLSDSALREALEKRPETLGSLSIGKPSFGRLVNGVRPTDAPLLYHLVDPAHAWGTVETVESVCHAISVVASLHPGTSAVDIGHLSAKDGGPLSPHRSHQSGRDVDLGLYYKDVRMRWYTRATRDTLDVPRTWTLVRTLATDTDIEMILLDQELQEVVERYALSIETDRNWVSSLFHRSGSKSALVRHSSGHKTHLHLRFLSPIAQESARRLGPFLTEHYRVRVNVQPTLHIAHRGDTLANLAQQYHTTIAAIRQANRMQSFQLVAGHRYTIPGPEFSKSPDPMRPPRRHSIPRGKSN